METRFQRQLLIFLASLLMATGSLACVFVANQPFTNVMAEAEECESDELDERDSLGLSGTEYCTELPLHSSFFRYSVSSPELPCFSSTHFARGPPLSYKLLR